MKDPVKYKAEMMAKMENKTITKEELDKFNRFMFGDEFMDSPDEDKGRAVDYTEIGIKARLEYLRGELDEECISLEELAELESLKDFIEPGDTQLLEAAGVPEFPES